MLQNLRDNLKGTVAVIVIIIFVVPLVLFGVEQLFVGSAGGAGAASVNGEQISQGKFQRELLLEKQQRQQRFNLEPNSPQLDDSIVAGPVLKRMARRLALYQAATTGGMGASKDVLWKQIAEIDAFKTDGKFDYDLFKSQISSNSLYTTSSFLEALGLDLVLGHVNTGVSGSSFVTEQELALLASITQQKRTFYSVKIPKENVSDVDASEEEVATHYQENTSRYVEPETMTIEYVELSLNDLAEAVSVKAVDIQAAYDTEVSDFVVDPAYQVAHILLTTEDGRDAKVSEITAKLANKEDFSALAKMYSEDPGSKDNGGDLGEMIADSYPTEFVAAAQALSVGSVSGAVTTDAGVHFIKLLEKTNAEPPTFEDRKESIARQISLDLAQNVYTQKIETLGDATFSSDSLEQAAEALDLEVEASHSFARTGGLGILSNNEIVAAAYADDVLKEGHNSRVIEISDGRAIVLRMKTHQPESIKPLDAVKDNIKAELIKDKQSEILSVKAGSLMSKLASGGDAEELAKELGYEYRLNDKAARTAFDLGGEVIQKVFSLPRPIDDSTPVLESVIARDESYSVVGLLAVEDGLVSDMEEAQLIGLERQLNFQVNQLEMTAYEAGILSRAEVVLPGTAE